MIIRSGGHLNIKMSSYQYRDPHTSKDGLYIDTGSWYWWDIISILNQGPETAPLKYIPKIKHMGHILLCLGPIDFYPYPSGLLHSHCGNIKIALYQWQNLE